MLDKLSANISDFGNNVLFICEFGTKSQKKSSPSGMVYGLNEQEETTKLKL